jgi:hypothetical protein
MLDLIAKEREICIINRPDGENIALIPESDLNLNAGIDVKL